MQPLLLNPLAVKAFKQNIKNVINDHFQVKDSYLNEALARSFGENTYAALVAKLKMNPRGISGTFNKAAFVARLMELDYLSAEAVGVLLEGVKLHTTIEKRGLERQRADKYLDVAYDVTVEILGVAQEILDASPRFILPDFSKPNVTEPYRLDSAFFNRVEQDLTVTRHHAGRQLMTAKLINGRWEGGFYVYAPKHQINDANCILAAKAALARAILPAVTSHVRCWVFRPDGYDYGAWRIQISLGPTASKFWGDSNLAFKIPQLPYRRVVAKGEYLFDFGVGTFVNGEWQADLYSNGVIEEDNPTSIGVVKAALFTDVNEILREAGF